MIKYLIQTSPHDAITSQEVVGVLGVEEVEKVEGKEGVAELGPIAVLNKGKGVLAYDFIFFWNSSSGSNIVALLLSQDL